MRILREQDTDRIMRALGYRVVDEKLTNKIWQPNPHGLSVSVPKVCPADFLAQQFRQLGLEIPPDLR